MDIEVCIMTRRNVQHTLNVGIAVALLFPLITAVGLIAHGLMGCSGGGSSGPVGGCRILGLAMNFPANLATPAFVISFFTVPVGFVIGIVGLVKMAWADPPDQQK